MSHDHHHGIVSNLKIAFLLNASFTIIEFAGGLWTNSIAILSDAFHDLGDTLIILFAILLERIANKPANSAYTYGYRRVSLFAALSTYATLVIGSVIIIIHAVPRIREIQEVDGLGMMYLSILGIAFNSAGVWALSSGHSHNQKAVKFHLIEDVLGWIAVLIGSLAIIVWDLHILDPILSILIAIYIAYNAVKNSAKITTIFLQKTPDQINIDDIKNQMLLIDGIAEITDLKVWSLDGEHHIGSVKIIARSDLSSKRVEQLREKSENLLKQHQVKESTIQVVTGRPLYQSKSDDNDTRMN